MKTSAVQSSSPTDQLVQLKEVSGVGILEDLKGEKATRMSLLLQLSVGWGVSLDGFSLLLSLLCDDEVETFEPELEEVTDEEGGPILPRGGRARSGAGKRTC